MTKLKEQKHPGGRPPKYTTPEEMQGMIDEYFEGTEKPTVCGLALFLGFQDRQSILDYQHKNKFSCTIKKAKMRIQQYYEEHLVNSNSGGSIFALKNFGWRDDKNYNIGGQEDNPINITVTVKNAKS